MSNSAIDDVWEVLCAGVPLLGVLFALNVVLLVALVGIFPFVEAGSPSYYVSIFSFVLIGCSIIGIVVVIRKCRARN